MSKLEDTSPSLSVVSEWSQEPYDIEFIKKGWSSFTLTNMGNPSEMVQDWSRCVWNLKSYHLNIFLNADR